MNFKSIGLAAIAATTVAAGATLASSPAQALSITSGSEINFATPPLLGAGADISASGIDFFSGNLPFIGRFGQGIAVTSGTGDFANANFFSLGAQIKDLTLPSITAAQKTGFISGINLFPSFASIAFDLSTFNFDALNRNATFTGFFRSGSDLTAATGLFTAQSTFNPTSYSLSIKAAPIPTPALLPGLIGLGIGVLRKRKAEKAATVEA